jgi:hypothetical protein
MEPLRSDMRPAEALSGTERDARIEQLLLAGLDQYFAHQYEQAINVWTRVLFLDRTHDRARAYIERARRAQAEVQRESEAMLHEGIEAFHEGDVARARDLVAAALDRGAPPDEAHGMLDRIERLGAGQTAPTAQPAGAPTRPPRWRTRRRAPTAAPGRARAHTAALPRRGHGWMAAALLVAAAIGALAVGAWGVAIPEPSTWPIFQAAPFGETRATVPIARQALPLPGATETFLARAHALAASGRLHDALRALDRIPIGDPLHADAERLRAEIQRQLLAIADADRPPAQSDPVSAPPPE